MQNSTLDHALKYQSLGWYVLPLYGIKENGRCNCPNPNCPEKNWGKHPRTVHGLSDASNEVKQITELFTKWPDSNIGIHCKKSGLVVLDKDPRNGGDETLRQLILGFGELPLSVKSITGGGGSHDCFQYHKDFGLPKGFSGKGLDIRNNAYIVVPPSKHKSGNRYEWVTDQAPWEIPLAAIPDFLIITHTKNENIIGDGTAEEDLEKLSGKDEVRKEIFTFKANSNETLQILVNGKPTGAWIDLNGYIGSHTRGGPTVIQWIEWYGYSYEDALKIAKKYGIKSSWSQTRPHKEDVEGVEDVEDVEVDASIIFPSIDFPIDVFPSKLAIFIKNVSHAYNVPIDTVAVSVLTIISGAIGNSIRISPKRDWLEPPFLWSMIIGRSGSGKSPFTKKLLVPVDKLQSNEFKAYKEEINKFEIEFSNYQKRARLKSISISEKEPEKPSLRHYKISDTTVEALAESMKDSPRGVLITQDEMSGFINGFNQYKNKGNDRQKYLELWDCSSWKIDRVSTGCKFVSNTGCGILGGIQPLILPSIFKQDSFIDGLLPRFLFSMMSFESNYTGFSLSKEDEQFWEEILNQCYALELLQDHSGFNLHRIIKFDSATSVFFKEFRINYKEKEKYLPERAKVFIPKLTSYTVRFSGILQILKGNLGDIKPEILKDAIKITDYFSGQSMAMLGEYDQSEQLSEIEKKIIRILSEFKSAISNGKLKIEKITNALNIGIPDFAKQTPKSVSSILIKKFKLQTKVIGGYSHLIWEHDKMEKLFVKYRRTTSTSSTAST